MSATQQTGRAAVPPSRRPVVAVTTGEPAGIGPEISIRAAWAMREQVNAVLIGDAAFLAMTAADIDPSIRVSALSLQAVRNGGLPHFGPGVLCAIDIPLGAHVKPGVLDKENGRAVLATLDAAIEGVGAGWFEAVVTAPLQKSTINDAGVPFSGHTEYFADRTATPRVVMLLAGQPHFPADSAPLRVALATTHLPLKDVSAAITRESLAEKTNTPKVVMMLAGSPGGDQPYLRVALATTHLPLKDVQSALTKDSLTQVLDILHADLVRKFGLASPRILVTGLNPHAGENGY
ncbi:MAG TPA: 4-hydroxythreonine-4-phosphate dehydrogenase PdxA, partial [Pseudoduganella sp.]